MAKRRNDRKDQRRKEAELRHEVYTKMDPVQLLAIMDRCGLAAKKERIRLGKKVQK